MTGNSDVLGSDLARVDTHQIAAEEYDELPELIEEDFARGTVKVAGNAISKPRGRPAVNGGKEQVAIRLDKDVLAVFRAEGPGWQSRINDVLRKAVGF